MALLEIISRLRTQLVTSGLQKRDNPLFQVINQLIGLLQDVGNKAETDLNNVTTTLVDADYITWSDESTLLPNSRELLPGDNVTFDDSVANERTIDVTVPTLNQVFLTGADEVATLPNSRELLAGSGIAFDDSIANERTISSTGGAEWSVLTNGEIDNPELIFIGGDVIMGHTP